jgi:TolB-like protein
LPPTGLRRLCVALLLCSSIALIGARHRPAPTPTPVPTASPTPISLAPSVVVYPFEASSDMPAGSGPAIAQIFDQQLSTAGGLSVLAAPAKVVRIDYLTAARKIGADYYISGYITPVGDGAAMVVQVVGTVTGVMIFSRTAQISTVGDASSQALAARELILQHAGRMQAEYNSQANATPTPSANNGANVSLGGLGSLFGLLRHGKGTGATPPPTGSVPQDKKPSRVAILARVTGLGMDAGALTTATQYLRDALDRHYLTQLATADTDSIAKTSNAICGSKRDATIDGGTLVQTHGSGFRGKTETTFTLKIFTCFGAVLYSADAKADSIKNAINAAVEAYAAAHPQNS